ncbi:MAG: glycosyl transferase [Bacteroidales bacterium]|nr:glycosyl transferase [Bacteroidales bacterium]
MFAKLKRKLIWNVLKLPLPDKWMLSLRYYQFFGVWIDWRHPRSFNEKIQYMKLYDRRPEYVREADKCRAKQWVAEKVGARYVVPDYGVWTSAEAIDFDGLPDQFVLKCNHDSGSVVICTDKSSFDREGARKRLSRALKRDFSKLAGEWVYRDIPRRVFAERYLDAHTPEGMVDYKFFCFHGAPEYLYVSSGLSNHATARMCFLFPDWTMAPFQRSDYLPFETLPPKPSCLEEMLSVCRALSEGHPFLRIDLYEIEGRVYFSEATFYPNGGYIPFLTPEMDVAAGAYLKI